LDHAGISTIGQLIKHSDDHLLRCRGLGYAALIEIKTKLKGFGIRLPKSAEEKLWPKKKGRSIRALQALRNAGYDLEDQTKIKKAILNGEIKPNMPWPEKIRAYGKHSHAYICEAVGIPYYIKPRVTWGCPCCGHQGKLSDFKAGPSK